MKEHLALKLRLSITADEYLAFYRREANDVMARTLDGRSIQFPANALRKHVSHEGVYGLFEIIIDRHHKLISLERIES